MAEFEFYGTWLDMEAILKKLVPLERFNFVIDKRYLEPKLIQFENLTEENLLIIKAHRKFYLWSEKYSKFPPKFGPPNSNGEMRIRILHCGPAIEFLLPVQFEFENKTCFRPGSIMFQAQYFNLETREIFKPSDTLKSTFYQIKSLIQKSMVKRFLRTERFIQTGESKVFIEPQWIGLEAIQLIETNKAEILLGQDRYISNLDLAKKRSDLSIEIEE
ncbi:MAG: hypothetical protein P4L50_29305 [Anaerolineaceae bacterium]|nr:hypothetical protein [Anaerolineaceae bacterium]